MPLRSGKTYQVIMSKENTGETHSVTEKNMENAETQSEIAYNEGVIKLDAECQTITEQIQAINLTDSFTTTSKIEDKNRTMSRNCKFDESGGFPEILKFEPELGIHFSAWLTHFNQQTEAFNLDNDWKFKNFRKFIGGSALKLFLNQCLCCRSFNEIIQIFEEHYFTPSASFLDFQNLKFSGNAKDLHKYFTEKVELGRRIQLNTKHILEGLSVGLPPHIKACLIIKEPNSPSEWLQLVSRIINDAPQETPKTESKSVFAQQNTYNRQPQTKWGPRYQYQNNFPRPNSNNMIRPSPDNFCRPRQNFYKTPQIRNQIDNRDTKTTSAKNHASHFSQDFPPKPCKFCAKLGIINAFHWGQSCINKPNSFGTELPVLEPKQTENQNDEPKEC